MDALWRPDILGPGFEQLTLPLGDDNEGPIEATLVRALPAARTRLLAPASPLRDVDVLFVHGWSDYFFNRRFARFFTDRGARFHALDLRKYGRSLREGQTPGYITDLADYDAEMRAAFAAMGRRPDGTGDRRLVLAGHSTGGLVLSLWAARHPGVASGLVLNSPWLEFQFTGLARAAISPILEVHSRFRPLDSWPQVDLGFYARAVQEVADPDDPIEIRPEWKPERAMTVYIGWIHAIIAGHGAVAQGLGIDVPVCVLLSSRSLLPTRWQDDLTAVDSVLAVDDIARAALKLGSSVTVERVDGALHDVFLSRKAARDDAYARMGRWVDAMLAAPLPGARLFGGRR